MWSELIKCALEDAGISCTFDPKNYDFYFSWLLETGLDGTTIWMGMKDGHELHFAHQWEIYDQFVALPDLANPATDPEPVLKEILAKRAAMVKDGPRRQRGKNE